MQDLLRQIRIACATRLLGKCSRCHRCEHCTDLLRIVATELTTIDPTFQGFFDAVPPQQRVVVAPVLGDAEANVQSQAATRTEMETPAHPRLAKAESTLLPAIFLPARSVSPTAADGHGWYEEPATLQRAQSSGHVTGRSDK
jgi:hypothetical protein